MLYGCVQVHAWIFTGIGRFHVLLIGIAFVVILPYLCLCLTAWYTCAPAFRTVLSMYGYSSLNDLAVVLLGCLLVGIWDMLTLMGSDCWGSSCRLPWIWVADLKIPFRLRTNPDVTVLAGLAFYGKLKSGFFSGDSPGLMSVLLSLPARSLTIHLTCCKCCLIFLKLLIILWWCSPVFIILW